TGLLSEHLSKIVQLPKEQRAGYGLAVNRIKDHLTKLSETRKETLKEQELVSSLRDQALDVTLSGRPVPRGRLHLATQVLRDIQAIFADLGFQIYQSREVEDDLTNFELLNMPPHHPARDMWDTFHTTIPGVLLRTHTSPGQ